MLFFRGTIMLVGLLLLWEGVVLFFQFPPYILPSPWQVAFAWYENANLLLTQAIPTVIETLVGLLLGIIFGGLVAFIMAFVRPVTLWILPLLIMSQSVPTFAIAPLLVIWFGYGMVSKIVTTVLMIFFPITSAFYDGLRQTNSAWLDLANIMQGKRWRIFWNIRIPAALPHFASGLRVATVIAPIGAIIGEWVGASRGLGFLMLNANARMQMDLMFAALSTIILFSLLLYYTVNQLLRRFITW